MFLEFFYLLRARGLEVSINEWMTLVEALDKGLPMPIDVYDAATWMAISALSAESIKNGSQSVPFPDFTHGAWKTQREEPDWKYRLEPDRQED